MTDQNTEEFDVLAPEHHERRKSDRVLNKVVRLVIFIGLMLVLFVGYVFYQSYEGRVNLVDSQRAACERSKKDRSANAQGWRIAEEARRNEGQEVVALAYSKIAAGLEERSQIVCDEAFPKASFIP